MARLEKKKVTKLTDEQWEDIKILYRANQLSLAQIAKQYGITSAAISMRANRKGWERNLGSAVREEIKQRVRGELVGVDEDSQEFEDRCVIEQAADMGLRIVREHQGVIAQYIELVKGFVLTLEREKINMDPKDWSIALNNAASALDKLIKLDRQAANISQTQEGETEAMDKVDQMFAHIHDNGSRDEEVI